MSLLFAPPRPRAGRAAVLAAGLALLAACESQSSASQLRVHLIRADGENAASRTTGHLLVEVRQRSLEDGLVLLSCAEGPCESAITAGDFDLVLPIPSLTDDTLIRAEILDEDEVSLRVGALPPFAVYGEGADSGELPVRLVMEPVITCALVEAPPASTAGDVSLLSVPRRDAAGVVRRNTALVVGGVGSGGDSVAVDHLDQLVAELRPPLPSLPIATGPARGLALSGETSLIVGARAYLSVLVPMSPPTLNEVALHEGASFASALVPLVDGGVVVGGDATRAVTWLSTSGTRREPSPGDDTTELVTPRAFAAAVALADGVLVVGGEQAGPGAEWLPPVGDGQALALAEFPAGALGGWLAPSPDGHAALFVGFTVDGALASETYVFRDCPACTVEPGPAWPRPRADPRGLVTAAGTLWIVGGDGEDGRAIDLVLWDDSATPRFVEGPELVAPRAGATLIEHAAGIVTVIGGENPDDGMLADFEHCTPPRLDDPQ